MASTFMNCEVFKARWVSIETLQVIIITLQVDLISSNALQRATFLGPDKVTTHIMDPEVQSEWGFDNLFANN
jgi:hypothetical protein